MRLIKLASFPYRQGEPILRFACLDGDFHPMVGSMNKFSRMYGDFIAILQSCFKKNGKYILCVQLKPLSIF